MSQNPAVALSADEKRERATTAGTSSTAPPEAISVTERALNRATYVALRHLTGALSTGWQLTIHGAENLPATGGAIIAANHVSFLDSPLLMFELPRRVWFLGKAEYLDARISRSLFPALGMIPVERGTRRAALTAMKHGLAVIDGGELLGVFPEGTRSRDGRLHRGHTGLAWLALRSGVPVVPIGITGTDEVQPPGNRLPRLRGDCSLTIGEPIKTTRYKGRDKKTQRALTDDVMFEIGQLSGQTYVDRYATAPDGQDRP